MISRRKLLPCRLRAATVLAASAACLWPKAPAEGREPDLSKTTTVPLVPFRKTPSFPSDARKILQRSSQLTVYSLQPNIHMMGGPRVVPPLQSCSCEIARTVGPHNLGDRYKRGSFHDNPILGRLRVRGAVKTEAVHQLLRGFAQAKGRGMCFRPRLGIRAVDGNQFVDLVICFHCSGALLLLKDGQYFLPIDRGPDEYFRHLFKVAGIPVDKSD